MFKKAFDWIVWSSKDPKKISLTLKMAALAVVPYVLYVTQAVCSFGTVCIDVDAPLLEAWIQSFETLVFHIFSVIAAVGGVYAIGRKIFLSIKNALGS